MAQSMAKQKIMYTLFLESPLFCMKDPPPYLQQCVRETAIIIYIYLYIETLKVVRAPNGFQYQKTKKKVN